MRGREIDIHHRAVGEVRNLVQAGDRWDQRPPAHIDEDVIGMEHDTVHCHFLRPDARNGILARLDRLHINPDGAADRSRRSRRHRRAR